MEQLLFLAFILFSIASALLERRKRRKQQEEQQQRKAERQQGQPQVKMEVEEEKKAGWPFGGDPFELEQPVESQAEKSERETLATEREALAAERRALEVERLAVEMSGQIREHRPRQRVNDLVREHRPRQRVNDLVRERMEQEQAMLPKEVKVGKWKLNPAKARDAIIYAEILGPPKAERRENF